MGRKFIAKQPLGIRGIQVVPMNRAFDEDEIKDKFIEVLERLGILVLSDQGASEVSEPEPKSTSKEVEDVITDENFEGEYPVLEGQKPLTDYENTCYRKYLKGEDITTPELAGVSRAMKKLGLEDVED